ncbi:sensor histidine kinase NtrY-like [Sphingomonas sp. HMP6]|uniref:sensor histidine kinase NtrY-like n=1 Tax=Sphingomonas sp. HMP6 TaxID=1517551 RepID=UPI001596D8BD|nr:ATP-binding protein [Sphingomonas sp. HMP6]BCA58264.1 two-component system sensor histidine kinase [Sphingomonas sp. HMP6]
MNIPSATNLDQRDGPRRPNLASFAEIGVLLIAAAIAIASYFVIADGTGPQKILAPPVVALLLVANLLPGIALLVLIGRRIAMRRAARSPIGGRARLHVRLVALFSVIAAVPTLFVVVFASLLFQYGVQFWYSDQARSMIENATGIATTSYEQMLHRWQDATVTSASAISQDFVGPDFIERTKSPQFIAYFNREIFFRSLSDGFIFVYSPGGKFQEIASLNPDRLDLAQEVSPADIARVEREVPSITTVKGDRIKTLTMLPGTTNVFYLTVAISDVRVMEAQSRRSVALLSSYRDLLVRSQSLQLKFNAALLAISLLIVAIAVWIALEAADRLVRPVGELVGAAQRVAGGDLTARVPAPEVKDEIGTLGFAFNQMTERLQAQTSALESRRALIEAVMSGVSAGIISVAADGTIRLINSSAVALLDGATDLPVGKPLAFVSPELATLLDSGEREAIVEIGAGNEARTLAVKVTRAAEGPILTFDDITGQLLDQRRAAWSDVARRIAHEIKNPLTPIQLAAERLQRRYGKQIDPEDTTFARLTDTIVRQVGDLRRMVDEFSSFARMPKPVFRAESLVEIARQTLFLHEVAHPGIAFTLAHDDPGPTLVCDRRQIGQALTNIVKNAVEAVEANLDASEASIAMTLSEADGRITITLADTGIGLPAARDRIVEPYVTTRARGTGLGLAIVKKIVEEHFGTIAFDDRPGGGTIVTTSFDTAMLANLDSSGDDQSDGNGGIADARTPELQQNRT